MINGFRESLSTWEKVVAYKHIIAYTFINSLQNTSTTNIQMINGFRENLRHRDRTQAR